MNIDVQILFISFFQDIIIHPIECVIYALQKDRKGIAVYKYYVCVRYSQMSIEVSVESRINDIHFALLMKLVLTRVDSFYSNEVWSHKWHRKHF